MLHFTMDGFQGYRSRFDDLRLVHELMEELPDALGLQPAMPPFLLPYYNGVHPDDCGISAFVFLVGGHLTIHTFSVRECFFADLVYPTHFDASRATRIFSHTLPCRSVTTGTLERFAGDLRDQPYHPDQDFGPHLFLDIEGYTGARDMNALFRLFEELPARLDMTPIMRPYIIEGRDADGREVISAMTMIAESHIALHVFPESNRAYFDIFSCRPFDQEAVQSVLMSAFRGERIQMALLPRGRAYTSLRSNREDAATRSNRWTRALGE